MDSNTSETNSQNTESNAQMSSPLAQVSKSEKFKNQLIGLGVLILLIAAIFIYSSVIKQSKPPVVENPAKKVGNYIPTLQETKNVLANQYKTDFPQASSAVEVTDPTTLPAELGAFWANGAVASLVIKKITFSNNKTGYDISYTMDGAIKDLVKSVKPKQPEFTFKAASRANLAAFSEYESKNYNLRIEFGFMTDTQTQVHALAVQK